MLPTFWLLTNLTNKTLLGLGMVEQLWHGLKRGFSYNSRFRSALMVMGKWPF